MKEITLYEEDGVYYKRVKTSHDAFIFTPVLAGARTFGHNGRWTKEQDAELVGLYTETIRTMREIGAQFGRSEQAVYQRLIQLRQKGMSIPKRNKK